MKRALNAEKFCQVLGVSQPTGYVILQSGVIPAVQVGKRKAWRVLESEVVKFLRGGGEVNGGPEKVVAESIQATR